MSDLAIGVVLVVLVFLVTDMGTKWWVVMRRTGGPR